MLSTGSDEEEQTVGSKRSSQSTRIARKKAHLPRIISIEEDHLPHLLQDYQLAQSPIQECSETPNSPRARPVGKETGVAVSMPTQKVGGLKKWPVLGTDEDDAWRKRVF